jgi:hypothetical protein
VRQFRDAAGVEWRVSLTTRSSPAVSRDHYLPEAFREGWLLFESAHEKRRLAPVPSDWESLSDQALAMLCANASPQPARPKAAVEAAPSAMAREEPLRPKLVDAEKQLDKTLDEVCESPEASKLDTGELIRVEESLALAAEAAKEAVSLRRRMRADQQRDEERPQSRTTTIEEERRRPPGDDTAPND